ncbi:MAG: hypothetical protein ABIK09_20515 [Pseudomonadota bacterium]
MAQGDLRRVRELFSDRRRLRERLIWTLVLARRRGAPGPRPAAPAPGGSR